VYPSRYLAAPFQLQFAEHVVNMRFGRPNPDLKLSGDLFVAEPGAD